MHEGKRKKKGVSMDGLVRPARQLFLDQGFMKATGCMTATRIHATTHGSALSVKRNPFHWQEMNETKGGDGLLPHSSGLPADGAGLQSLS